MHQSDNLCSYVFRVSSSVLEFVDVQDKGSCETTKGISTGTWFAKNMTEYIVDTNANKIIYKLKQSNESNVKWYG